LNELCQTLFKIFPGNDLTKKRIAKIFTWAYIICLHYLLTLFGNIIS
jgi:hypothetical protein